MIRVFLVRHGETVWHAENRYAGKTEVELSDKGREQAKALARWAKASGIQKLYVSPQARAAATMRPAAEALAMKPVIDPRLREIDFGLGEGLTGGEMKEKMPEDRRRFEQDPVLHPLPGGEDPRQVIARGREALQTIVSELTRPGGSPAAALAVTHNTLIRLLLCDLLGINPSLYRKVFPQLEGCRLTELGFAGGAGHTLPMASLLQFNAPPLIF